MLQNRGPCFPHIFGFSRFLLYCSRAMVMVSLKLLIYNIESTLKL